MRLEGMSGALSWLLEPLRSRKVRVALATVIAAYAGQGGLDWNEQMILTVLGVGVALILGIAHEDAGAKSAGSPDRFKSSFLTDDGGDPRR